MKLAKVWGSARGLPCPLGEHTTLIGVIVCYNLCFAGASTKVRIARKNTYLCISEGNAEERPSTNGYASSTWAIPRKKDSPFFV